MTTEKLREEVEKIYDKLVEYAPVAGKVSSEVVDQYRVSARNLYNYLIMRSFDNRKIHDSLSDLGISSLRSAEGYVLTTVVKILKLLYLIQGETWEDRIEVGDLDYSTSKKMLLANADRLFNDTQRSYRTEIMVTMPDEAAEDYDWVKTLIQEGMEIARINLSHGNTRLWKKILKNVNKASRDLASPVKVYMDLPGPKIRTKRIKVRSNQGHTQEFIKVKEGEELVLTKRKTSGAEAQYGEANQQLYAAEVGVLLPQIIDDLNVGDKVFFDDGKIEAVVIAKDPTDVKLSILRTHKKKLSSNKGINLPDTHLHLSSLTKKDIELLPFVSKHADLVGYSFVRKAEDVNKLYQELDKLGDTRLGVIFKIENKEAFNKLPSILFEGMKRNNIGVMIARGDLAVEIGFDRISEVQDQILWICEAAHVPVIWATQVLENQAKTGIATRAEISDAALSAKAECVMLNKGPYMLDAVRTLRSIIIRMEAHSFKKKSSSRALKVAKRNVKAMNQKMMATLPT